MTVERLIKILENLRIREVLSEYEIHNMIAELLYQNNIVYEHEAKIGPRCRVDFLVDGIAIEVKRGKPDTATVTKQVERYCASPEVTALILVTERALIHYPKENNGKPVRVVALSTNWGVAL